LPVKSALATLSKKIRIELYVYATILVAFFLRVHRLGDKNIWWDECWSIWLAQQDWIAIALRTASDEHPPLHYWMLRAWSAVAGTDAFAARFLSVAFGVLTVALIYRIARSGGGAWIGIIAALFLATARFNIWWSQDVKNYTSSIFFAFVAVGFALQILNVIASAEGAKQSPNNLGIASSRKPLPSLQSGQAFAMIGWRAIFLYALFAALALWTHYLAALILIALNVYALITLAPLLPRSSAVLKNWILANALAAALFAPWLWLYLQNAAAWTAAPTFDFGLFLQVAATVLPLGVTTDIENYPGLVIAFTAIVALGMVRGIGQQSTVDSQQLSVNSQQSTVNSQEKLITDHRLLFTLILLLPPALIYLLSLTPVAFFAPKIQARYLLILLPAYAILLALGIAKLARLSRVFAFFAVLFIFASNVFVLRDYYATRRLRDDYATLANTINAYARQGDLVLLDTDQEWPTFLYYLRAPLEWLGVPNGKPMRVEDADALITRALARHPAVWLVAIPDALATDPQKLLEARLARELPKRYEQTFDDKRLALYARDARDLVQVAPENLNVQRPVSIVPFPKTGNSNEWLAQLTGYDLPMREARAGDAVRVTTYWHAAQTRGELQLADSAGRVAAFAPLEILTGKDVRVVTELRVPPDAAGDFAIRVRVGETTRELARISVEPRGELARVDKIANRVDYAFGSSIRLSGFDLPQKKFRAGESVPLTLYWRAERAVEKSYIAFAHLLGAQFNAAQNNFLWGQIDRVPGDGKFPTNAWRVGEIVPDVYRVRMDAHAPPGAYKIEIGLYDPATGARLMTREGADNVIIAEIEVVR